MNNSEILSRIIENNKDKKTSSLRKVQILQLAVIYGTTDDISACYNAYHDFEMTGGALALAIQQKDFDKVECLISHNAKFMSDNPSYELAAKYNGAPNYLNSLFSDSTVSYQQINTDLATQFAGCDFKQTIFSKSIKSAKYFEKTKVITTPKIDDKLLTKYLIHLILNKAFEDTGACPYSDTLVFLLLSGKLGVVKECEKQGISISFDAIKRLNLSTSNLSNYLNKLKEPLCQKTITYICDAADHHGIQIMMDGGLLHASETISTKSFAVILDRCNLNRFTKTQIVQAALRKNDATLLEILEKKGYLNSAAIKNEALELSKKENLNKAHKWLEESNERISENIKAEKNKTEKSCDSEFAKWFTHKGEILLGLSKTGIKAITQEQVTSLTLPEVMDGISITRIHKKAFDSFADLTCLTKLIIPSQYSMDYAAEDNWLSSDFPNTDTIKTLVFIDRENINFRRIKRSVECIEIPNSKAYRTIDGVVYSKDLKKLLYYPHGKQDAKFTVPEGVTNIVSVNNENLKDVIFASSVRVVEDNAFRQCDLQSITFNEGLKVIGKSAFTYCNAKEVVFPESLYLIESEAFSNSKSRFIFKSDDISIESEAFKGCKKDNTYSPKIQGKMQRCGYKHSTDIIENKTRDAWIEELHEISGRDWDVPEAMETYEIAKTVKGYKLLKEPLDFIEKERKPDDFHTSYLIQDVEMAAIRTENEEVLRRIEKTGFSNHSHEFFPTCMKKGEKWLKLLLEYNIDPFEILESAIWESDYKSLKFLLEETGYDINKAHEEHYESVVSELIHSWINMWDNDADKNKILQLLIKKGADVKAKSWFSRESIAWLVIRRANYTSQVAFVDRLNEIGMLNERIDQSDGTILSIAKKWPEENRKIIAYIEDLQSEGK